MNAAVLARVRQRYRDARGQAPGLRLPYFVAPLHRRSTILLRRRLRQLGVRDGGRYVSEVEALRRRIEAALADAAALLPGNPPGGIHAAEGAFLYALVRGLRPSLVAETGTAHGVSTTYLLSALAANDAGRLVSIDLPFELGGGDELLRPVVPGTSIEPEHSSPLPPGRGPGWIVPAELRGRWELRLGDARALLPPLLDDLGRIDVFFHDSLHTREHMLFEFERAWAHLKPGGVLVSDDVALRGHDALPSFAHSVGRPFRTFGNLGFVRK